MKNENDGLDKDKNENDVYDTTDVKAVRRTVTNVYSRGTYNPSAVDNSIKLDIGRVRGGQKYQNDEMEEE